MNRILVALVLALSSLSVMADDRQALVGVWRYVSEVDTRVDGSPAPASAWESASIAELRETVTNGNAYAGRYELDPSAHTITWARVLESRK